MRLSTLISCALAIGVLGAAVPAHAQFFTDIPETDVNCREISDAAYHQLMEGYPDGKFHPDTPLLRGEGVMVMARLLNSSLRGFMLLPGSGTADLGMPDIGEKHWLRPAAAFLAERGMLPHARGTAFKPYERLSRGEFMVSLHAVLHRGEQVTPEAAMEGLREAALLPAGWGEGLEQPVLRREAAVLLEKTLFYLTQNAVTEGKITRFETDDQGNRWVILDTRVGEGRLFLPPRGVLVEGGQNADLREGMTIRTMSDAVAATRGAPYYRVREVTILG